MGIVPGELTRWRIGTIDGNWFAWWTSPFTSQYAFSFLQRGWPKVEREPAVVYDSLKEESPKLLAMVPAGIHLAGTARV